MKINKKSFLSITVLFVFALLLMIKPLSLHAEANSVILSADDYTDSNFLLKQDGTQSSKTIDFFHQKLWLHLVILLFQN